MNLRFVTMIATLSLACAGMAQAECAGSYGRGWARDQGQGTFQMAAADRQCVLGFANFIDEAAGTRTPATEVALTRAPKAGSIGVSAAGVVYTPHQGFKGSDTFCTRNSTAKVPGKRLSGCITVTVR